MRICLKKLLRYFDIFGQPVTLNIGEDEKVNTSFGGFMTLCLFIIMGFTFGYYSVDCFFKKNPQIIYSTEYRNEKLYLNQTHLIFKISTDKKEKIDLTPFLIVTSWKSIPISDCVGEIVETNPFYENIIQSDNWYCIYFNNSADDMIKTPILQISYCTHDEMCKSREEINNLIMDKNIQLDYKYSTRSIDVQTYKGSIKNEIATSEVLIFPEIEMYNEITFTPHQIKTDDGFVFTNSRLESTDQYIPLALAKPVYETYPGIPTICSNSSHIHYDLYCTSLYSLILDIDEKVITIERTYKRIADVLANVGGIQSFLMLFMSFIMSLYTNFIRDERISNYLYDFDTDEEKKKLKKLKVLIEIK